MANPQTETPPEALCDRCEQQPAKTEIEYGYTVCDECREALSADATEQRAAIADHIAQLLVTVKRVDAAVDPSFALGVVL